LLRLAFEQGQHGLVATVHAVKVANSDRTGRGYARMLETAENLHDFVIFLIALRAWAVWA
jgi:hypothetical protein